MPIPNRQLKDAVPQDILADTRIVYEGNEGLIVAAKTFEAKDFWSNGEDVGCAAEHTILDMTLADYLKEHPSGIISSKYPMLIQLPFTDDPGYSRLSANHASYVDPAINNRGREPDPEALARLLAAAVEKGPDVSILLYECGVSTVEMPEASWAQEEFMDYILKKWPQSLNYMPVQYVTTDIFTRGLKSLHENWGEDDLTDTLLETPKRFHNLLSENQVQELEQSIPGLSHHLATYGISIRPSPAPGHHGPGGMG